MSLAARPNVATDIDRDSGERASTAGSSGPRKKLLFRRFCREALVEYCVRRDAVLYSSTHLLDDVVVQ